MAVRQALGESRLDVEDAGQGVRFEEVWAHAPAVRALCRSLARDESVAEDLFQETYARVLRCIDGLHSRESLEPLLATIARRAWVDHLRRGGRHRPFETVPEPATNPDHDPAVVVAQRELVAQVQIAMAGLTPQERALIADQLRHGLSISALAEREGTTGASVRSSLFRARAKLRTTLIQMGALAGAPLAALRRVRRRLSWTTARARGSHLATPAALERFAELLTVTLLASGLIGGGMSAELASGTPAAQPVSVAEATSAAPTAAAAAPRSPARRAASEAPPAPDLLGAAVLPEQASFNQLSFYNDVNGQESAFAVGTAKTGCASATCPALFQSRDGGATWVRLPATGFVGGTLLLPPAYPGDSRIFAVSGAAFQVSRDHGATFTEIAPIGGPAAISPDFSTGDPRLLIGRAPTWEFRADLEVLRPIAVVPPALGTVNTFAFAPGDSGVLFVGGTAPSPAGLQVPAVFRCLDGACSQQTIFAGRTGAPSIAVSKTFDRDGLVFAWLGGELWRSADHGVTFSAVALPVTGIVRSVSQDAEGHLLVAVEGSPFEGSGGLLVSGDDGRTFTDFWRSAGRVGGVQAVVGLIGDRIVAAPSAHGGGGLLCTTDGGRSWASRCGGDQ